MPRHPAVFLAAFVAPASLVIGISLGGAGLFLTPLLLLGILPLVDLVVGRDSSTPPPETLDDLRDRRLFRWVTWLWVPTQVALLLWTARLAASLSPLELVGLVLSLGLINGGIGITVAHELIHRDSHWERGLGQVLLMIVGYMHFFIEHIQGHHRNVATDHDPASARRGESVYRFVWRSLLGGYASAWRLETRRLRSHGLPLVSRRNRMIWFAALPLGLSVLLGLAWGATAALVFWLQAVVAVTLLEMVNYIEHYGLQRRPLGGGATWEPVGPEHSWNADFRLTNAFLFGLQLHADHHLHPRRRYQTLRSLAESPELPLGYAGLVWLAALPPLWRRVMDPRLPRPTAPPARPSRVLA